jgi:predicted acyltransferase
MATASAPTLVVPARIEPAASPAISPASTRLLSLDVFRGLTMLLLISHGFGIHAAFRNDASAAWLANQFEHAAWVGCTLWDLIQPAFTFIVGAAMPLALARRIQQGGSRASVFRHVLWRAFVLIALSNVLSNWNSSRPPVLQLINVLCQIAFGYVICFAIMQLRFRWQVAAALGLIVFHMGLFFAFPGPAGPFDPTGNIGAVIDRNVLGYNYSGNYTTINFLGNAITILFGVWTGMLLSSRRNHTERMRILAGCAAASFALGLVLATWIPMVKRLWLPSFTFFSTGWVLLFVLALYWAVEIKNWRRWTFPAAVVGMNCIFIYAFSQVLRGWLSRGLGNFTGQFWFLGTYGAIVQNVVVMGAMWYLCYWLYRRKIFFKI